MHFLSPTGADAWHAWNVSLPPTWLPVYKARLVPHVGVLTSSSGPPLQRPLFVPNEGGYVCFRGQILLSAGPSCLIAATEARAFYNPGSTHCGGATPKALAVKTSHDGGATVHTQGLQPWTSTPCSAPCSDESSVKNAPVWEVVDDSGGRQ